MNIRIFDALLRAHEAGHAVEYAGRRVE